MTDEVYSCTLTQDHKNLLSALYMYVLLKFPPLLYFLMQNKLVTVSSDTKILQAMQLMTGSWFD